MTSLATLPIKTNDLLDPTLGRPLQERALTARLHIERPSFRKTDKIIEKNVAEQTGSDPSMHSHRRLLLAKGSISKIQNVISAATEYHRVHTLPWEDKGIRILPTSLFDSYMEEMRGYQREFEIAVEQFLPNYPTLIEEAKPLLGGSFNEDDYPPPLLVAKRFAFAMKVNNLNLDFRCSTIGPEQEARIRAEIEERAADALQMATRNLFEQAHEHVTHMVERLHAYNEREEKDPEERRRGEGTFKDTLVTNLKEFVERLPKLNLTGDPKLEEMRIKLLRQLCAHAPEDLRKSPLTRNHVLAQAEAIQAAVSELI